VVAGLLAAAALPLFMPDQLVPGPRWLTPAIIVLLSIALLAADPGRIDRRSQQLHRLRLALVVVLAVNVSWATVALADALVHGSKGITDSANALLSAGGLTWLSLVIAFGFLYWELDMGGPGERANTERRHPDLAFPQDFEPELARPGWQPTFVDYLYLGLTNNLAFSPTDVMPLAHWAKAAMALQSIASLLILGLVVSRAVNILQ
jgi:uncharacterized membrane protein